MRTIEVKKIDKKKVASLLREMNLWIDEKKVEIFPEKEIQKQVFLDTILHAKGNPVVVVNPYTDQSYWNWKKNYINIGVLTTLSTMAKGYDTKEIAKALFYHELSHENHTSTPKNVPYPFALLNILEDERIERLAVEKFDITEKDFAKLHEFSFDIYYKYYKSKGAIIPERVFNPYNLLILHRWLRWWSREKKNEYYEFIRTYRPKEFVSLDMDMTVIDEYTKDIEKVLDDATNSKSTEELIENTEWFYEKWKDLLTPEAEAGIQMGAGHGSGESAGDISEGYGSDGDENTDTDGQCDKSGDFDPESKLSQEALEWIEQTLEEAQMGNDPESEVEKEWDTYEFDEEFIEESKRFSSKPIWKLNPELVKSLESIIRQIRWQKKNTRNERVMLGKRVDPRRVENLLPNPMKRNREVVDTGLPKVLFVIDGSGSMDGNPYYNAIHLATAFSNVLKKNVQIVITTPEKAVKVSPKDLLYYECDGFVENLRDTKKFIESSEYDLIVFFTDAEVVPADMEFLYKLQKGKWKDKVIGMITTLHDVNEAREWLSQAFYKSIVAKDIINLTKELAFRIKRGR